jgi:hypothetical protein
MAFLTSLPATATLLHLFGAYPETSTPLIEFHKALLRGRSAFSSGERELIATYVPTLNGLPLLRGHSRRHGQAARSR